MKTAFFLGLCLFCISCKEVKKDVQQLEQPKAASTFIHYEMSEMALLMEQMYVDNMRIKKAILADEAIADSLPSYYMDLEKATLTDPTDRDLFFTTQLNLFLRAQRLVYEEPQNRKQHFNAMVESCIACHQVKCGGPIERIKKLLIP
ncbi:hypothetical protein [Flavobacterium sp. NKUCC04_CG]|uniref:hypothetical protein n=1 Tax=Flavobacterium sp. NKUCC04_CG TaxID=2842121 RepID=UPI001C5AE3BC|nr:hypothetical protein [Flavobacterium sp. NKUCC04_CG]MBW3518730.1 hypothetical protein [Flavobacterium sp. NKUCC04_CG]